MLSHCSDPRDAVELLLLRENMRGWRFYDHFRTDSEAPARRRQVGTHTPGLGSDGADLAAAMATMQEAGSRGGLARTIDGAFPGAASDGRDSDGYFEIE